MEMIAIWEMSGESPGRLAGGVFELRKGVTVVTVILNSLRI